MALQPDTIGNVPECRFPPGSRRVEYKDLVCAQKELSEILRTAKQDPTLKGISHLGSDGIYRCLTADRDVVDAIPLTPPLIKALLDRFPYSEESEKKFRGVDGTKTPKEKWYKPLCELPPPLRQERRTESEEKLEENRQWYYERRKKIDEGLFEQRAVCLMSDHDLGPGAGKCRPDKIEEPMDGTTK
jgi:hypothetical protein